MGKRKLLTPNEVPVEWQPYIDFEHPEIVTHPSRGRETHVWLTCPQCGKRRLARADALRRRQYRTVCCSACRARATGQKYAERGVRASNWKDGRDDNRKYPRIHIALLSEREQGLFAPMINSRNYLPEHRLVMARHLDRPLEPHEIIHHVNGNTHDNRIENLKLYERGSHAKTHRALLHENAQLHQRIEELEDYLARLGYPYPY